MVRMRREIALIGCLAATVAVAAPAFAEPALNMSLHALATPATADRLWPSLPAWHGLTMDQRITDHLSELGNLLGHHLDLLTDDVVRLKVNGRANRAWLRVGGGDVRFLALHLSTDWHFVGNIAEVYARLQIGVAGHKLDLALPEVELSGDSYHGQQLVVLDVPLLQRHF